jgi:hypothetical protein
MNRAVEIFKIFAAMSDHGTRKRGQRFCRNFDRTGNEKLVVRNHRSKRPTSNPPSQGYGVAGVQPAFAGLRRGRRPTSIQVCARRKSDATERVPPRLFFDEGNVAAAFDVADPDILELLGFRGQTQVFFDIVSGDVIPSHGAQNQITVLDD